MTDHWDELRVDLVVDGNDSRGMHDAGSGHNRVDGPHHGHWVVDVGSGNHGLNNGSVDDMAAGIGYWMGNDGSHHGVVDNRCTNNDSGGGGSSGNGQQASESDL